MRTFPDNCNPCAPPCPPPCPPPCNPCGPVFPDPCWPCPPPKRCRVEAGDSNLVVQEDCGCDYQVSLAPQISVSRLVVGDVLVQAAPPVRRTAVNVWSAPPRNVYPPGTTVSQNDKTYVACVANAEITAGDIVGTVNGTLTGAIASPVQTANPTVVTVTLSADVSLPANVLVGAEFIDETNGFTAQVIANSAVTSTSPRSLTVTIRSGVPGIPLASADPVYIVSPRWSVQPRDGNLDTFGAAVTRAGVGTTLWVQTHGTCVLNASASTAASIAPLVALAPDGSEAGKVKPYVPTDIPDKIVAIAVADSNVTTHKVAARLYRAFTR